MEMDKYFVNKYRLAKHRPNGISNNRCTLTSSVHNSCLEYYRNIVYFFNTTWYYIVVASVCDWPVEICSSQCVHLTGNRPSDHNRVAPNGRHREPVSQKSARNNAMGMTDRSNLFVSMSRTYARWIYNIILYIVPDLFCIILLDTLHKHVSIEKNIDFMQLYTCIPILIMEWFYLLLNIYKGIYLTI